MSGCKSKDKLLWSKSLVVCVSLDDFL